MLKSYNLVNEQPPAFPDEYRIVKSAVLNRTDLNANNNKFYVLEIHEAKGQYRLFTNYGRVGADGVKEGRYADSLDAVQTEFERIYKEKTSPRKGYLPIEVEKATVGSGKLRVETERAFQEKRGVKSSELHGDVARFIEHIYEESKSELARRIETPLGSLSLPQIDRGADKLKELRFALARNHQEAIVPLTSQYYSLIPHKLGRFNDVNEVAINTVEKADSEEELLQLMRDVYHVQEDLEAEVDQKYHALGARISVVERGDADYARAERKILQTQSKHHYFNLRVNRLFRVELPHERQRFHGEGERYGNVQELFHGTKNCNMVGILSRGLLIAPKNVPVTGYMFGKGVYFADQSTKSAQYSLLYSNNQRPYAYMFLADVALGRIKKETSPCYREDAPDGYDSVQGCKGMHLVHNEFIVYRTHQCTLRYIAEIALV